MNSMFPHAPKGRDLPIPCKYPFVSSVDEMRDDIGYTPARWQTPIPEGWKEVWIAGDDDEPAEAGFKVAALYVDKEAGTASYTPGPGREVTSYLYLRDHEGSLVATWDEGRWWTPDESNQFQLMLLVPATLDVSRLGERGEYGEGRR